MFKAERIHTLPADKKTLFDASGLKQQIEGRYQYTEYSFNYYDTYHEGAYQDFRWVVFHQNMPVLALMATRKGGELGYFHFPGRFFECGDRELVKSAWKFFLTWLDRQIDTEFIHSLRVYEHPQISLQYLQSQTTRISRSSMIDLTLSETTLKANLRKSYKSLVNWGARSMKLHCMDAGNAKMEGFSKFKEFHQEVAGRITRSEASWEVQFKMIKDDQAFLVMGYLEEQLVSANLVLFGRKEVFYGVGVNNRELMKEGKPVSHYPLWYSILESKRRGFLYFDMNEVNLHDADAKLNNISLFKLGFASEIRTELESTIIFKDEISKPPQ